MFLSDKYYGYFFFVILYKKYFLDKTNIFEVI